ncbi:hypothetical protein GCM10011611_64950 [Aliidongia dinghuensis]|uniref:Isocitrate lyase/phosphoenolpyruvate mutase family protein n=1 Tax=Aliidongia dinghuensis TaxID=1867774 RepID=A0A8J3E5Q8_9PROT|nr:isocitrate lyase/phosphoenolpyruvate mutase family protein [Aliidongia dinghuensis]GGF49536.1 hypothetical protein GCM10011611_64950 [Aliidongia dinghuensis]
MSADYESGFAHELEELAANVWLAIGTGVAGLSIEDIRADGQSGFYDTATTVERIRTARTAIERSGEDVILVARTEILLSNPTRVAEAIDKLVAFADAGADCLYAPGVAEKEDIAAMVRAVAPKPVNLLIRNPGLSQAEIADLGVRRISGGGGLARAAWSAAMRMAEAMKAGSFEGLASGTSNKQLKEIFSRD